MIQKNYFYSLICLSSLIFADNGPAYHQSSHYHLAFAQSQLSQLSFRGNERILDVGCRAGRISQAIAQLVPYGSVVAVDSSKEMIASALNCSQASNLTFKQADEGALSFDQEFDLVFSFFKIRWLKNKKQALEGIARAVKKDGQVYLFVPIPSDDFNRGIACIEKLLATHPEWVPFMRLPENEPEALWIKRIEDAGFEIMNKHIEAKQSVYANKKEWDKYCYGIGLSALPEPQAKEFISMANDLLYEEYGLTANDPYTRTTNILCLKLALADREEN